MSDQITKTIMESLEQEKLNNNVSHIHYADSPEEAIEHLKSYLLQSQIKLIEAVQQQLRDSQWECPEHGLPEFSITECLECENALSINVILQDQISSLNETLEFLKKSL